MLFSNEVKARLMVRHGKVRVDGELPVRRLAELMRMAQRYVLV